MDGACVVCGSSESRAVFDEFGTAVARCRRCGHLFSTHEQAQDYEGYFGEEFRGDTYWWDEAHRRMHEAFCSRFLRGRQGQLLDIGCGLGFFLKRAGAFPGWRCHGCEISPSAVRYARESLGLADVRCGRVEDAEFVPGQFQIITLWDVIEHLPDPDPLLRRAFQLLSPGGMLFLHTPNGPVQLGKARLKRLVQGMKPGSHYLEARDHMHLYSPRGIASVLERCGFTGVRFLHLPPIQSVSGSRSALATGLKNVWWQGSRAAAMLTRGRVNLDNLFVTAEK